MIKVNTFDITRRALELSKKQASGITPKLGTTVRMNQFFVIAGYEAIKKELKEKGQQIAENNDIYSEKMANEHNAPIIAERDETIRGIKDYVRKQVNGNIDARVQQADATRKKPIRDESMSLLQTIKMLIDTDAHIDDSNWKIWAEQFTGHFLEETVFAGLAHRKGIDIIPVSNPDKSIEHLEQFRDMANHTIDRLDTASESIIALSFLNDNPHSPLSKLIDEIDSDLTSIIPTEKLSVMKRLKQAQQKAYDADDVRLSARIKAFTELHNAELSTPEELKDELYAQAEELISQGMSAKK